MNTETTYKVAPDVADLEFQRFVELNAIDADVKTMTPEELSDFNKQKRLIVLQIMLGNLTLDENGVITYVTHRGEQQQTVIFHEPTGASMMAMDRRKKSEDVSKMFAAMADMCRCDAKTFAQMKMADLKVCLAIVTLFLA